MFVNGSAYDPLAHVGEHKLFCAYVPLVQLLKQVLVIFEAVFPEIIHAG